MHAVDAKVGLVLGDLLGSDLCHGLDGVHSTVLCQGHRDDLESIGEGPNGILLQRWTLRDRGLAHKLEGVGPPDKQNWTFDTLLQYTKTASGHN